MTTQDDMIAAIRSFASLKKGWDTYDAEPPNTLAIENAERLARISPDYIFRVAPCGDGGITVYYTDGGYVWCDNDGEIIHGSLARDFVELGYFTLHSGENSCFRFDVNALSDKSLAAAAAWLVPRLPIFGSVYGIPNGGVRFAKALEKFCAPHGPRLLVDDVLTTGGSMEKERRRGDVGAVFISRGKCPDWITPFLIMPEMYNAQSD